MVKDTYFAISVQNLFVKLNGIKTTPYFLVKTYLNREA